MVDDGAQDITTDLVEHSLIKDPDETPKKGAVDAKHSIEDLDDTGDAAAVDWDTLKRTELHERHDSSQTPIDTTALRERFSRETHLAVGDLRTDISRWWLHMRRQAGQSDLQALQTIVLTKDSAVCGRKCVCQFRQVTDSDPAQQWSFAKRVEGDLAYRAGIVDSSRQRLYSNRCALTHSYLAQNPRRHSSTSAGSGMASHEWSTRDAPRGTLRNTQ